MTDRPIRFLLPDIALGAEMKNSVLMLCQRFLACMETWRKPVCLHTRQKTLAEHKDRVFERRAGLQNCSKLST